MKFSKQQLDNYSNLCGLIIGITTVLVANRWIPAREGATVAGVSGAIVAFLTNKPALKHPNTEDLEEREK